MDYFHVITDAQTGETTKVPFTPEEVAATEAAAAEAVATEYQRQRAAEYPPLTDYLDGIVKGDKAQVQAYIDACKAVKAKYPKPD